MHSERAAYLSFQMPAWFDSRSYDSFPRTAVPSHAGPSAAAVSSLEDLAGTEDAAGMRKSADALMALVAAEADGSAEKLQQAVPSERVVLGGFSQVSRLREAEVLRKASCRDCSDRRAARCCFRKQMDRLLGRKAVARRWSCICSRHVAAESEPYSGCLWKAAAASGCSGGRTAAERQRAARSILIRGRSGELFCSPPRLFRSEQLRRGISETFKARSGAGRRRRRLVPLYCAALTHGPPLSLICREAPCRCSPV